MGGDGSGAVGDQKLAVVGREGVELLGGQVVEDVVGGGRDDLVQVLAVLVDGLVQHLSGDFLTGSAVVAGAEVHGAGRDAGILLVVLDGAEVFLALAHGTLVRLVLRSVGIVEVVGVVALKKGNRDPLAVRADPLAQVHAGLALLTGRVTRFGLGAGDGAVLVIDGGSHAPDQLLGGEAVQTHVRLDGGQGIAEAEAVRQENIGALLAEFLLEEAVPVEDLAHEGLGGGNVGVHGVPGGAGDVPAAVRDIALQLLIEVGIVFLRQLVAECAFEVHAVVRILVHQLEIALEGALHAVADGILNGPVPLGVQMGVGHAVELFLLVHEKSLLFLLFRSSPHSITEAGRIGDKYINFAGKM